MTEAVRPPLPEVDLDSEAFWTGGREGELRITRCRACRLWLHPPRPVCRRCLGDDVVAEPVSGRARVLTYTINHQAWIPGLEVPYVLAIVELVEQRGLRLTTRLVDLAPDEVAIGQSVVVRFEQVEDVWLPVFGPEAAT